LSGSRAIDGAPGLGCPAVDQRGVRRPRGAGCDIGAYEWAPPSASTGPATSVRVRTAKLHGTAANPDVQTGTVFFQYGTSKAYGSRTPAQSLATVTGTTGFAVQLTKLKPGTTYHYRIVASNPDGTQLGADAKFKTPAPVLSGLRISPRDFALTGRLVNRRCVKPRNKNAHGKRCKRPITLRIGYTLNTAAAVALTLRKREPGRQLNGRCVKPTHRNKNRKRCMRLVTIRGRVIRPSGAGRNSFIFDGRIGGHSLAPGTYLLIAKPAGGASHTVTFTIVR
jgi:hypothetical protein